jgi:hypothetical protein
LTQTPDQNIRVSSLAINLRRFFSGTTELLLGAACMKTIIPSIFLLLAGDALAGERRDVPHELFGVPLGAIVTADPETDDRLVGLPSIQIRSFEKVLGHGVHVYFKPSKDYPGFPYVERPGDKSDTLFETNFRLYLLPIIPDTVKTKEQLRELTDSTDLEFEVNLIEWRLKSEDKNPERDAYMNARRLCATFSLDFVVAPEIDSQTFKDWHTYTCDFEQGERRFRVVGQYGATRVSLQDKDEIFERKENALEQKFKRLELERIRPY